MVLGKRLAHIALRSRSDARKDLTMGQTRNSCFHSSDRGHGSVGLRLPPEVVSCLTHLKQELMDVA